MWQKILLTTFSIHSSWLIYYHLTPGLINIPHHQCAILWRQSCTNFWKRLQQHLNCIYARQLPSLSIGGPLVEHTCMQQSDSTLDDHSWWILAAVSFLACRDLEAPPCLHDHDDTDRFWQVCKIKKAGIKPEIKLHAQTCHLQWTTYAGTQPRWSCSYASGQRAL